jgi:hypothetical protein
MGWLGMPRLLMMRTALKGCRSAIVAKRNAANSTTSNHFPTSQHYTSHISPFPNLKKRILATYLALTLTDRKHDLNPNPHIASSLP